MNKEKNIGLYAVINIILLALIVYASTSLTVSFFSSIGTEEVKTSNLILGIVNDACKIFLPMCVGISLLRKKYLHATVLIAITLGAMVISYMASQGQDLNISNGYLLKNSTKNEIVGMKNEAINKRNTLVAEKNARVEQLTKQMNAMPSNYITRKNNIQTEIDNVIKDYNTNIYKVDTEISSYNDKILNYKVDASIATEGYHALATSLGTTVDKVTKFKNIFLEVIGIVLSLNLGMLIGESGLFRRKEEKVEVKAEAEEPKKKSSQLSEIEVEAITDIDIQKYLKVARSTASNTGKCIGYKKIGEMAGITNSYKIYKHLKDKGIIEMRNNNAYLKGA